MDLARTVLPVVRLAICAGTLLLAQRVAHTRARDLINRDGDLHLTVAEEGASKRENPQLIMDAAISFLASHWTSKASYHGAQRVKRR